MERIKENDKVLVKAKIQNKANKECYFLGRVINKRETGDSAIIGIQLEGEEGIHGIKLKKIGSIEDVKKTIIPMDFIFKDENIKAEKLGIPGEYDCGDDTNCDGELDSNESGMGGDDYSGVMDEMNQDAVEAVVETTVGGRVKENEALKVEEYDSDDFGDFEEEEQGGGKKKKKKNRSRSKKNKKKRKRRNSTKKKN